ncbi:MAG: AAA family ATPase [Terriglobales bacterium]
MEFATLPELPERVLVLMIGLPGAGKSSFLAHYGCPTVATDTLRELLWGSAHDQRAPAQVFGLLRKIVAARLQAGAPQTFVDATNLAGAERQPLVRLAGEAGVAVYGIWMDTGVDECLWRNRERQRQVEEEVVRRMARKLRPPTVAEGVEHLYRVSGSESAWVY